MLTFVIMRLIYGVYVMVAAVIFYRTLSLMIFHKDYRNFKFLLTQILLIPIWPLGLFSDNGRIKLAENLPFKKREN